MSDRIDSPRCECCGLDRPWSMVADPHGNAVALCGECIETLIPQWFPWGRSELFET